MAWRPIARGWHRAANAKGYSLVELLLAMTVGLILMGSALLVTRQTTRASNVLLDGSATQEEVQFVIEWITTALRSAGANPYMITTGACPAAGTVFTPIQLDPNGTGLADNVRIEADINPPNGLLGGAAGACNEGGEDLTIAHNLANLTITKRDNNLDQAAVVMTDRVISSLRFTYLNAQRVATAVPTQVAYVQVSVTGQTITRDEYRNAPTTYTLTSEVRLRLR
ncbi:MAG: prepilin-type N-terminal cleavage/methylation domain-containing protein [Acidobacteria bacterium]|nr:prepilin-type N-terminal cleavage/methylation domain-containing protein [Acidobacteriota bacterium]